MNKKISCTAVIVAGGKGLRMGTKTKKQFLSVNGETVLAKTIKAISKSEYVDKIVIVCGNDDICFVEEIVGSGNLSKVRKIVGGGETRALSVKNGLMSAEECDIILIHDGVRPYVSAECIDNCIENAFVYGASALGVKPKDTIKTVENGKISETLDRDFLCLIQTPQCFKYEIIKEAYFSEDNFDSALTDDCAQVEKLGYKIHISEGSYKNIKITTPEDIKLLEFFERF